MEQQALINNYSNFTFNANLNNAENFSYSPGWKRKFLATRFKLCPSLFYSVSISHYFIYTKITFWFHFSEGICTHGWTGTRLCCWQGWIDTFEETLSHSCVESPCGSKYCSTSMAMDWLNCIEAWDGGIKTLFIKVKPCTWWAQYSFTCWSILSKFTSFHVTRKVKQNLLWQALRWARYLESLLDGLSFVYNYIFKHFELYLIIVLTVFRCNVVPIHPEFLV